MSDKEDDDSLTKRKSSTSDGGSKSKIVKSTRVTSDASMDQVEVDASDESDDTTVGVPSVSLVI